MSDYEPPSPPPQLSFNVPQLVAFLLISALAVRWLFFSSSSTSRNASTTSSSSARTPAGRRIDERQVEQVQAIFPQYGRREIMWDLMRNGGSVQATTERILGGRGLDHETDRDEHVQPPPTFQPPPAPGQPSSTASSATGSSSHAAQNRPKHPNLITRYGLSSKVAATNEEGREQMERSQKLGENGQGRPAHAAGWSQNKETRQAILQRRREEMILAARKRLLEKKE